MGKKADSDIYIKVVQEELTKCELYIKSMILEVRDCDSEASLHTLNGKIRARIKQFHVQLSELQSLSQEEDREDERQALQISLKHHKDEASRLQTLLRKENISAQNELDRKQRDLLFSDDNEKVRKRDTMNKQTLVASSGHVTESLQNISRTMSELVDRSHSTLYTLAATSHNLTQNQEEFKGMGSTIHQSRQLLGKYGRREFTDKILICLALVFFFACVLYIVQKRIF